MLWVTLAVFYIGICWLFFKYPHILHKKLKDLRSPTNTSKIWIIAHRGGSYEKPENTIEAFQNSLNSDVLELDVVHTKDYIIVVSHDNSLSRISGQNLHISDLNYSELPAYARIFQSHFLDTPTICNKIYKFTALEDVFKISASTYICIDIKVPDERSILEIKRLIDKYKRAEITVITMQFVGNGGYKHNKNINEEIPNALKFMSFLKVLIVYFSYIIGIIGLIPIKENLMAPPIMTKRFSELKLSEMTHFKAMI